MLVVDVGGVGVCWKVGYVRGKEDRGCQCGVPVTSVIVQTKPKIVFMDYEMWVAFLEETKPCAFPFIWTICLCVYINCAVWYSRGQADSTNLISCERLDKIE